MAALAAFGIGCGGSHAASDAAQASDAPAGVQAGTAVATVQAFPQLVNAIGTVTPRRRHRHGWRGSSSHPANAWPRATR